MLLLEDGEEVEAEGLLYVLLLELLVLLFIEPDVEPLL